MNDKEQIALEAVKEVKGDMVVGLGTGSTANCFIEALARRCRDERLRVTTVASSVISAIEARRHGLPQIAVEQVTRLDLYVDGADEVTPDLTLLSTTPGVVEHGIFVDLATALYVAIDGDVERREAG